MALEIASYIGIALGVILAAWGLFHQLVVGGAVTAFRNISETEAGFLPAALLLFFGPLSAPVHTTLLLSSLALILLSAHVFLTGFHTHFKPIRIGAVLQMIYGVYLLVFLLFANPLFD
jgi:hypothetical protein